LAARVTIWYGFFTAVGSFLRFVFGNRILSKPAPPPLPTFNYKWDILGRRKCFQYECRLGKRVSIDNEDNSVLSVLVLTIYEIQFLFWTSAKSLTVFKRCSRSPILADEKRLAIPFVADLKTTVTLLLHGTGSDGGYSRVPKIFKVLSACAVPQELVASGQRPDYFEELRRK
jgi:hypothetical protein